MGTGDAVKSAVPYLDPAIDDVIVLCGDVPLIQYKTLTKLVDYHHQNNTCATILAVEMDHPYGYGRIIQDSSGNIVCIKEEADANDQEKEIKMVNSGIYCFKKAFLTTALEHIKTDNKQQEYYLTDLIEIATKMNQKVGCIASEDKREVIGVNTVSELLKAEEIIDSMADELP